MPRSSRVTRPQRLLASHRARTKALRDPSITWLGFACFRLVAVNDAALSFAPIRLAGAPAATAPLARPPETRRERSPRRVTPMDRVIRETLAMHV